MKTRNERSRDGNGSAESCDERLWKVEDVMSYLNVSRSWVYHKAADATLPSRRVGGLLRFLPSEIRQFAES
jgi:excisionase family DNA binding protein